MSLLDFLESDPDPKDHEPSGRPVWADQLRDKLERFTAWYLPRSISEGVLSRTLCCWAWTAALATQEGS